MKCVSIRKKGGTDQCNANAIIGHTLCGRHVRAKTPMLWCHVHRCRNVGIAKVQAYIRGWLLRRRLALSGPGVLCRKDLANDEELVTCEDKTRQHPFEYFAFEENGKVWWFNIHSLWKWSCQSHEPTNPYTKVPLSQNTRKRILDMWSYRQRHRLSLPEESTIYEERLRTRWNIVCQIFADNGFSDVHPMNFVKFGKRELYTMFFLLDRDLQAILPDSDPGKARALRLCRQSLQTNTYVLRSVYTLLLLMTIHKDPYSITFTILSALFRC